MFSFFKRLFKIVQSEAHTAVSQLEDPIKLTEQGIRDLKNDLESSMKSLAEVKAISISMRKELESRKQIAVDYERKALLLVQKGQSNQLSQSEADRLASEALVKKNEAKTDAARLTESLAQHDKMVAQLEDKVKKLKSQIEKWEHELNTLKARAKVASSTKKINQQLAQLNSDSTVAMLENMKSKIAEEEALAEAYDDMTLLESNIDTEINNALEGAANPEIADSLAALKARLLPKND
ncbi:MAG: PspA/IM30 family protein [bacterium]